MLLKNYYNKIKIKIKDFILSFFYSPIGRIIPDEQYIKIIYFLRTRKKINLNNPRNFNEKLQWLKLNDRNKKYTKMVDKYEAKKYVSKQIGEKYIIPTLGVWSTFDDINFNDLPKQFVLKCTHDSGGLVICQDKNKLDKKKARKKINKCLKRNFYYVGREWVYKDVKPRIIAESYMSDNKNDDVAGLTDYKFFCFNGKVKFLYISKNLTNHKNARISFVTPEWKRAPFIRKDYLPYEQLPKKPKKFNQMIEIAEKLSKNIDFLRVDLYEINNEIYFSELTFFPCNGLFSFDPEIWNEKIGDMLILNKLNRNLKDEK